MDDIIKKDICEKFCVQIFVRSADKSEIRNHWETDPGQFLSRKNIVFVRLNYTHYKVIKFDIC